MRAAIVLGIAAGCGLAPAVDEHVPVSTGIAPWDDLGPALVCLGTTALAPADTAPAGLCQSVASGALVACAADRDCGSRETCFCGQCQVAYCAVSSDCEAPRICNFAEHRCDLPCASDRECAAGEVCLGSVCRARCLDGGDCQQGEVCVGNTCISDDCSTDDDCFGDERCLVQRVPRSVREPAPTLRDGRVVLYLDLADPSAPEARAIWRAVSRDPGATRFVVEPLAPVIPDARAPAIAGSHLYFETATGIAVATTDDGVAFGAPTQVIANARSPAAAHDGDTALIYFERDGAIGLATGAVGGPLDDRGIVLAPAQVEVGDGTPGTAFWTPVTALTSPHVTLRDREVRLFFAGFGRESAAGERFGMPAEIPPNDSIGFAAATVTDPAALFAWPYGPVVDRVEVFLDHRDERDPATVRVDTGRYRMYFVDGRLRVLGSGR